MARARDSSDAGRGARTLMLGVDVLVVAASMILAVGLHDSLVGAHPWVKRPVPFRTYAFVAYLALPVWLWLASSLRLHEVGEFARSRARMVIRLIELELGMLVFVAVALFLTQVNVNRVLVASFLVTSSLLAYAVRTAAVVWWRQGWASGRLRKRILLIGEAGEALSTFLRISADEAFPPLVVGSVGDAEVQGPEGPPRLGGLGELARLLHDEAIDEVIFVPPYHDPRVASAALEACEEIGTPALFEIPLRPHAFATPSIRFVHERPFMGFEVAPKPAVQLALKHAFDFTASLLGLIALTPLFLIVGLGIVATMGWPIFFFQERIGIHGRRFRMVKFRSMIAGAEQLRDTLQDKNEMSGPVFKITDDPRVTRLGRFLRRSSIDELPQLINVLAGQMSLIGPRPLPVKEQQAIGGAQRRRLSMRPGITGMWQVSGRSNIDFDQWMQLDLAYVDRWSLRLDLELLLRTIPAVLKKSGAK